MGDSKAVIDEYLAEHPEVAALVWGRAAEGNPGPLVSHFSARAGGLPCPCSSCRGLSEDEIDRLS
jgi:hypothetical protein